MPLFRRGEKAEERSELYKGFVLQEVFRDFPNFSFCNCSQADLCLIQIVHSFTFSLAFLPLGAHIVRMANCTLCTSAGEKWVYLPGALVQTAVWGRIILPSRSSRLLPLCAQCWFPSPMPQCPRVLPSAPSLSPALSMLLSYAPGTTVTVADT